MIRACYIAATVLPLCHAVALSPQAPTYLTQVDIGRLGEKPNDIEKPVSKTNSTGGANLNTVPRLQRVGGRIIHGAPGATPPRFNIAEPEVAADNVSRRLSSSGDSMSDLDALPRDWISPDFDLDNNVGGAPTSPGATDASSLLRDSSVGPGRNTVVNRGGATLPL